VQAAAGFISSSAAASAIPRYMTLPHFVVTRSDAQRLDAVERFVSLGYTRCHSAGNLAILAHPNMGARDP
jgi:hypothetical protein